MNFGESFLQPCCRGSSHILLVSNCRPALLVPTIAPETTHNCPTPCNPTQPTCRQPPRIALAIRVFVLLWHVRGHLHHLPRCACGAGGREGPKEERGEWAGGWSTSLVCSRVPCCLVCVQWHPGQFLYSNASGVRSVSDGAAGHVLVMRLCLVHTRTRTMCATVHLRSCNVPDGAAQQLIGHPASSLCSSSTSAGCGGAGAPCP